MKRNIRLILSSVLALLLLITAVPSKVRAASLNPAAGDFIKDAGTDHFQMEGESQNDNVRASLAWRYGDYVYFALTCQKNVTVDPEEFKINGVVVGTGNFWLLDEGVNIKLYDGDSATAPSETVSPGNPQGNKPRIWIVGRILISNSSLELTFENLHHAHGWEIKGVTINAALTVTHQYGEADPILDFDQSSAELTAGTQVSVHPVLKDGYVYSSATVKVGNTVTTDILPDENGNVKFTVTDEMAANGVTVAYVYTLAPTTYTLTIHYVYEDESTAAEDHTAQLSAGTSYSVASPTIENYTPDQAVVEGNMPAENLEITVTYKANVTEPSTEPTEPSTEPTQPSTEPTEPSTEPTEPTQPSTEPTEPSTDPTEPTQPATEPTEPSTEPTQPATEATEPSSQERIPDTGDPSMIGFWIAAAAVSLPGVFILTKKSRKER